MAEGDFQAVDAVDGGIAGGARRRAVTQRRAQTHVHQVVLDGFRQVEGDQDPAFTNR